LHRSQQITQIAIRIVRLRRMNSMREHRLFTRKWYWTGAARN